MAALCCGKVVVSITVFGAYASLKLRLSTNQKCKKTSKKVKSSDFIIWDFYRAAKIEKK